MSEGYNEATYGDRVAEVYDRWHPAASAEMVDTLHDLAGAGPVLELGIGSGRVALPLAARGLKVNGIDASEAIVAKMRAKPGAESIAVTIGDFAEAAVDGTYSLILVAFNTFFMLRSQEEQVKCFANVAKRLRPLGLFVIEAFVPDLARFARGQIVQASEVNTEGVKLEVSRHDAVAQRTTSQQIVITAEGIKLYPIVMRYAWPSELDLMARLAGLRLRDRWGDWQRSPFTAASPHHISIYELPA